MKLNNIGRGALASILSLAMGLGVTACSRNYTLAYVYVTTSQPLSAGSGADGGISAYGVDYQSGALVPLADSPITAGRYPVTLVASPASANGQFIYVVNRDDSTVMEFSIGTDGKLYLKNTYNTTGSLPVAAAIDAAAFGQGSWDQVPAILSDAFPGSWGGLANMNFPENRLNFLSLQNMEPAFVAAYAEHSAHINPWNTYWRSLKGTAIGASEEVAPARTFIDTEFYNDWLLPQGGAVAAAGMKIVGEGDEVVVCVAGSVELVQAASEGDELRTRLGPGDYAINPAGTWHTADVAEPATVLFITAGLGTEHRPR